jgi:lysozyme
MRKLVPVLVPLLAVYTACAVDPGDDEQVATIEQSVNVCADGPTTYGIDVSRFQGDIDWDAVAASGVKFAYIQISRSLTDIDAKFEYNWRRAKEVGVLRGAYQRFRPGMDVLGQANLFLTKLGTYQPGDLPPVLDVEDADGLTGAQIATRVQQWMTRVEPAYGRTPIIYTGFYFWRDTVGSPDFSRHPLWVPNYGAVCPLVPATWTRWTIHQYSSTAMVPGITANTTDVNKFNGTYEQLQELAMVPPPACPEQGPCMGSGEETPVETPEDDPESCSDTCPELGAAEGGCSTSRDGSSLLIGLGLLALVRRRRRR